MFRSATESGLAWMEKKDGEKGEIIAAFIKEIKDGIENTCKL